MKEKLGDVGAKLKEKLGSLKKVPKKIWIIISSVLLAIIITVVVVVMNRPYSVLVTGVSSGEMNNVLSFLKEAGVTDYKIENNDTVLVLSSQEPALKAKLLMEDYPQEAYGYSTWYDHVGALSTESEKNINWLITVQERMGAVIRNFDNVKDAVVNITQGQDRSYILDSGNVVEATASVAVTMQSGTELTKKQAEAIQTLVAYGVQGLQVNNVVITDTTTGNTYTMMSEGEDHEGASSLKLRLEEQWENNIRTEVMKVLLPFFGEGNVTVGVNCVVDISNVVEERHDVYLPEWAQDGSTDGRGVIGAETNDWYVGRPGGGAVGGLVGSETNSDLPEYVEDLSDPTGDEDVISGSNQKDYDNPKSDKHIVTNAGVLQDCTVSVSINSAHVKNVDLDEIQKHVARAAGIKGTIDPVTKEEDLGDKVSVVMREFYEPSLLPTGSLGYVVEPWVIGVAAGVILLFVIILTVILMIRRKKKKKKAQLEAAMQGAGAPVGDVQQVVQAGADIMNMRSEKNMELRKDIRQFTNDNPEIAAQMIRGWLRGGDDNNG